MLHKLSLDANKHSHTVLANTGIGVYKSVLYVIKLFGHCQHLIMFNNVKENSYSYFTHPFE